jgi:acetyltransferase-like isoleucine patch superfamily enzyme
MIIRNPGRIEIGDGCSFANFVILDAHDRISIGSNCMFANNVVIATATHDPNVDPMNRTMVTRPVSIGSNVWFGIGATVLPGLTIGDGAIIGASAVVTRDVPARAIVLGVPGRVTRFRTETGGP